MDAGLRLPLAFIAIEDVQPKRTHRISTGLQSIEYLTMAWSRNSSCTLSVAYCSAMSNPADSVLKRDNVTIRSSVGVVISTILASRATIPNVDSNSINRPLSRS